MREDSTLNHSMDQVANSIIARSRRGYNLFDDFTIGEIGCRASQVGHQFTNEASCQLFFILEQDLFEFANVRKGSTILEGVIRLDGRTLSV